MTDLTLAFAATVQIEKGYQAAQDWIRDEAPKVEAKLKSKSKKKQLRWV